MSWDIAVAGTATLDDVTTPHSHRRDQVGGSAVYFALAASEHVPVRLCATVGRDAVDAVRAVVAREGIDLRGLEVSEEPTFRWRATHDFERWVTASEESHEGAYERWRPQLTAAAAAAPVLFAASMRPELQARALAQSSARLVAVDSMANHITRGRDDVLSVAAAAHLLFLDRRELALLAARPEAEWRASARALCGQGRLRAVVVKAGPLGAACVTAAACYSLPAAPVSRVLDPTGAGDALAGGFLGACAEAERDDEGQWPVALEAGLRTAAAAVSGFGTEALSRVTSAGRRPGSPAAG